LRILLVEDDHILGSAVRDHIAALGHGVDWMQRLDDATLAMSTVQFELIVLDLGLPDGLGIEFLKMLRRNGNSVPVIIATAQDQIATRIEGLNAGADDYIVKPFDLNELSARIAAVARRFSANALPAIEVQNVRIELAKKLVFKENREVHLTAREFAVLERLVRHLGAVVSREDIEDSLYQFGAEVESNAVQVFISRLRKKLGADFVKTIRGLGYQVVAK